jgi:hypothetical protein
MLNISVGLNAQISIRQKPISFTQKVEMKPPVISTKAIDLTRYLQEDERDEINKNIPFRFGVSIEADYNLKNSGVWRNLEDGGRLWKLKIESPQALSINLLYDRFKIPPGAKFFVYSDDHSIVHGAFTSINNKANGRFATAPTKGDACILEYYEPDSVRGAGEISVSTVVHGYKDVFFTKSGGFGHSGACNININCPEGDNWQDEKRAVALVITGNGSRICSGTLLNNTEEDLRQFFLTANHCLGGEESFIFMFNYESPNCDKVDGPTWQTVQGAILRATNKPSDFALLELTEQIPQSYDVYFAGWSAMDSPASSSVCIHHPSGDIKKISFDFDSTISSDYEIDPILEDGYWKIRSWDLGTTEGGSSGSALFDQNHHIIGQLKGGYASCSLDSADYFGKFSASWDYYADSTANLKYWLDPAQDGVKIIDGIDMNTITIVHTPLKNTENISESYTVTADIATTRPPLKDCYLIWGYDNSVIDSLKMEEVSSGVYEAHLPAGSDVTISYYISASDEGPFAMRDPIEAPDSLYSFYAGIDTVKPEIIHQAVTDTPITRLPLRIEARVRDGIGIDTVFFIYRVNQSLRDTLTMVHTIDDYYQTEFPPGNTVIRENDTVFYNIYARDKAEAANEVLLPESGEFSFKVLPSDAMICGYVSLSDSSNPEDISLFLGGAASDTAYTDSSGYYSFTRLVSGEYEVTVHKDGYFTLDSLISGISVNYDTVKNINFTLEPLLRGFISGFVNLEGSEDSSGVLVSIPQQNMADTSGLDGAFSFSEVLPGRISILFEKDGYITDRIDTVLNNGDTLSGLNMTMVKNIRPQNLHLVNTIDSVALAWDDITKNLKISSKDDHELFAYFKNLLINAEFYRLYRSTDSLHYQIRQDSITALCFTDNDVQIGEKYHYFIRAYYDGHWSENSDTVTALVESGAGYQALIYDNGTAVSGYFWNAARAGSGSRMSPEHRVKIVAAKFYLLNPVQGSNDFTAKIFDFSQDRPGELLGEVPVKQAPSNQWVTVDFSSQNISTDRDFVIFMEYDGINQPVFAFDTCNNSRAWDYDPSSAAWVSINQTYLMRADVLMLTGLESEKKLPAEFNLAQNYPNPFNPETVIRYELPQTTAVRLSIYSILGQKVRTLLNEKKPAGIYRIKWDGKNDRGVDAAAGIYILQFKSPQFTQVKKMLLIR